MELGWEQLQPVQRTQVGDPSTTHSNRWFRRRPAQIAHELLVSLLQQTLHVAGRATTAGSADSSGAITA
ncbi:MAG: hypothetical protein ABW128_04365 [Rhizorhabdus sp.]